MSFLYDHWRFAIICPRKYVESCDEWDEQWTCSFSMQAFELNVPILEMIQLKILLCYQFEDGDRDCDC